MKCVLTLLSVKVMKIDVLDGSERGEFLKEVALLANLSKKKHLLAKTPHNELEPHHNIITFFGTCYHKKWLVGEYAAQGSLDSLLRSKQLDAQTITRILQETAQGNLSHPLSKNKPETTRGGPFTPAKDCPQRFSCKKCATFE